MKLLLLFIAVALLAALASSRRLLQVSRSLHLQQISSSGLWFLLVGAISGPYASGVLGAQTLKDVRPLIAVGLGVAGMLIGLNLAPALLRQLPRRVFGAALAQSGVAFLAVALPLFPLLWKAFGYSVVGSLGAAALLGGAASVTSGHLAVVWFRHGRLDRLRGLGVMLLATLDDWLGLSVLAVALIVAAATSVWLGFALVALALLMGAACGALLTFLARGAEGAELPAILLGGVALVSGAAAFLKVSALLAGFACGTTLALIGGLTTGKIFLALARLERPAYLMLLFLIGAHWRLNDLTAWGILPAVVALRFLGKIYGGRLAAKVGRDHLGLPPEPGYALLGQGGMALCLATEYLLLVDRPSAPLIFDVVVMSALFNELIASASFGRSLIVPPWRRELPAESPAR